MLTNLSPYDKLTGVISILQNHVAGKDTLLDRNKVWKLFDMPEPSLELAIAVLVDILPVLEDLPDQTADLDGAPRPRSPAGNA